MVALCQPCSTDRFFWLVKSQDELNNSPFQRAGQVWLDIRITCHQGLRRYQHCLCASFLCVLISLSFPVFFKWTLGVSIPHFSYPTAKKWTCIPSLKISWKDSEQSWILLFPPGLIRKAGWLCKNVTTPYRTTGLERGWGKTIFGKGERGVDAEQTEQWVSTALTQSHDMAGWERSPGLTTSLSGIW